MTQQDHYTRSTSDKRKVDIEKMKSELKVKMEEIRVKRKSN
jgi:hypothetical protein